MSAFNSTGSVPGIFGNNSPSKYFSGNTSSTYFGNASAPAPNMSTNNGPVYAPPLPSIPAPSTPVKSITHPSGVVTTFHAPSAPASPAPVSTPTSTPATTPQTTPPAQKGVVTLPNGTVVNADTGSVLYDASTAQKTTYPGMVSGIVGATDATQAAGQKAADIAAKYSGLISTEQQNLAGQIGNIDTSGTTLQTALGREGVLNRTSLARQQALGTEEQGALAGVGQQISAQGQAIQGLQGAAGLTPEALRYGGTAGGTLNPLNNLDSIADQVIRFQISPEQANAMGGGISTWKNALNQALLSRDNNYNEGTYQAKFDANQANVQTGATVAVGAASDVYKKAYSDYQDLTQSVQNVDSFGSLLTQGMVSKDGTTINPTDLKWSNMAINEVRNQISSAQQAQFDSTYAALKSKISGLLSVGGSEIPSQITSDANAIISGQAPLKTLSATLQRIQAEGNILLTNQAKKVNDALTQAKGGTSTTSGSAAPGGFGWNG